MRNCGKEDDYILRFHSKEKKREQDRLHMNDKGRIRFIFLVWKMRRRVTQKEGMHKERKKWRESNQHLWNSEKEKRTTETMSGPRNPPPFFSGVTVTDSFPSRIKGLEEHILEEGQ